MSDAMEMKPCTAEGLRDLVARADDIHLEIHGVIGEWYLRAFEFYDDSVGRSAMAGGYVLADEAGRPVPYARLEALILDMNQAIGSDDYDFTVYQHRHHGHSQATTEERQPMTTDTLAAIELRSFAPDGSRYPSTGISPEEIEALKSERFALRAALLPFAEAWLHRQPRMGGSVEAYERRIERALAGFYSFGPGDERSMLTGQHLKDAHEALDKSLAFPAGLAAVSKMVTLMLEGDSDIAPREGGLLGDYAAEECDHDWDDMGDGTMACTYPDCNATRPKRPEDDEEPSQ